MSEPQKPFIILGDDFIEFVCERPMCRWHDNAVAVGQDHGDAALQWFNHELEHMAEEEEVQPVHRERTEHHVKEG